MPTEQPVGMQVVPRDVQEEKAELPTEITLKGMLIEVSDVQE